MANIEYLFFWNMFKKSRQILPSFTFTCHSSIQNLFSNTCLSHFPIHLFLFPIHLLGPVWMQSIFKVLEEYYGFIKNFGFRKQVVCLFGCNFFFVVLKNHNIGNSAAILWFRKLHSWPLSSAGSMLWEARGKLNAKALKLCKTTFFKKKYKAVK